MFSAKCPSLLTTFRKSVRFGRTMWIYRELHTWQGVISSHRAWGTSAP